MLKDLAADKNYIKGCQNCLSVQFQNCTIDMIGLRVHAYRQIFIESAILPSCEGAKNITKKGDVRCSFAYSAQHSQNCSF